MGNITQPATTEDVFNLKIEFGDGNTYAHIQEVMNTPCNTIDSTIFYLQLLRVLVNLTVFAFLSSSLKKLMISKKFVSHLK